MQISVIVFAAIAVYVSGEVCRVSDPKTDCTHETCDSSSHMVCFIKDQGDLLGDCTCADGPDPSIHGNGTQCVMTVDCTPQKFPRCRTEYTYCLNAHCRCIPGLSINPVGK